MTNYIYDKGDYHLNTIEECGLPIEHAYNHTTFFWSWLINNGLMSVWFEEESGVQLELYKTGRISINELYESWDCCFASDMLNDEGNGFTRDYFDFAEGAYLKDYEKYLGNSLETDFHVPYTIENEKIIHQVISSRYVEWQQLRKQT